MLVGVGLLISIGPNTTVGFLILYQLIMGLGMACLYAITVRILLFSYFDRFNALLRFSSLYLRRFPYQRTVLLLHF